MKAITLKKIFKCQSLLQFSLMKSKLENGNKSFNLHEKFIID